MASTLLLDDGEFLIRLATHPATSTDVAPVILERRCLVHAAERIGSAEMQPDGSWMAAVAADKRPPQLPFDVVAQGVARLDAIVGLWTARHRAYIGYHALGR
ncbi:hypothetical protein AACH06_25575 [Ideonella sp. DXS29W]|uniref:Uncharacterized protein n=1 Tax=Ideonella lacteola TaxID=2984193 RepID=A0ABU9BW60_9BURK